MLLAVMGLHTHINKTHTHSHTHTHRHTHTQADTHIQTDTHTHTHRHTHTRPRMQLSTSNILWAILETTTFARLRNSEQRLTLTRGRFLRRPYRGSWNGPNTKDYKTRDKYAEQHGTENFSNTLNVWSSVLYVYLYHLQQHLLYTPEHSICNIKIILLTPIG